MCADCQRAWELARERGMSEEDFMYWLWNETPFPIDHPSLDQIDELIVRLS